MAKKIQKPVEPVVKTLEIPNAGLALLYAIINVPLHGAQCRARNLFAKVVRDRIGELEDKRVTLCEQYAEKDADGKAKKLEGKEEYDLTPENLEAYKKAFEALMSENLTIDVADMRSALVLLRPVVLESKLDLTIPDGYFYEKICKAFEAI